MNYGLKKVAALSVVLMLSACGEDAYSVEHYIANPGLMKSTIQSCKSGDKSITNDNCQNAMKAELKVGLQSGGMSKIR